MCALCGFRLRGRARCSIKSRVNYVKATLLVAPFLWESHVLNQMMWTPMTAFQRPGLRGWATEPMQYFSLLISLWSRFLFPSCSCNAIASVHWNSVNTGHENVTAFNGVRTIRRDSTVLYWTDSWYLEHKELCTFLNVFTIILVILFLPMSNVVRKETL